MRTPEPTVAELARLLYRPEEAAKILGVSRASLYQLMRSDDLASVQIGRSRRVPADALVEFIARLRAAQQ